MSEREREAKAGTRERTYQYYTLGEAVRMLLCDVKRSARARG